MSDKGEKEWVLIGLDPVMAKQKGFPPRLPIPKTDFEGMAEHGLAIDKARGWIKDFLENSEQGKDGRWRKANATFVTQLEAFLDKAPLLERASKGFAENDYEKAIGAIKKILVVDADDDSARLNLAYAYANSEKLDDALKQFKLVKKTFNSDPDYHVALGQLYLRKENKDEATNEFVLALEAKPDHAGAMDALTKLGILSKVYEDPKDAASLIYIRTDSLVSYLTEQWDAEPEQPAPAAEGEAAAKAPAPRDEAFYLEQLAYHEREGRPAVAQAAAERAIAAAKKAGKPTSERAEVGRIASLRAGGNVDAAIAAAKELAERVPSSVGAQVELARSLRQKGDGEGAKSALDAALALEPGDQMALMLKHWPEDPNDIQAVHATLPTIQAWADEHATSPGAQRNLARALLAVGRHDDAIDLFKKAVDLAADDDDLRSEWWTEMGKQQRHQEVVKDAEKLDLTKRDWRLRWAEAEAYLGLDKRMEARTLFSAINFDDTLHVDIRRRAKRAVQGVDSGQGLGNVGPDAAALAEAAAKQIADEAAARAAKPEG
jgi:tetratricopeptide (TPR) repeat protein